MRTRSLTPNGIDEETMGEMVDRLEPLSREIVNRPDGRGGCGILCD
jgi:hypothetical protein